MTVALGLGIGRLVFLALHTAETVLAVVVAVAVATGSPTTPVAALTVLVALLLAVQLLGVRPALNRRSDRVLAGETAPRSRAHHVYIALELVKTAGLLALGTAALSAV